MDTGAIIHEILREYALAIWGDHGVVHWARVLENGLHLASAMGANPEVVTLFALFHDSRRVNEARDDGHGLRGAQCARSLQGTFFDVKDADFKLLYEACRLHTDGLTDGDVTLKACWDADRLDLGRVGIVPRPERLCSDAARELIDWAHERATAGHVPKIVSREWGLGGR